MSKVTWPGAEPERHLISLGGRTREALWAELIAAGVQLNEHAKTLLNHPQLQLSTLPYTLHISVVSVEGLGLVSGAGIQAIHQRARDCGLALCPAELGPYFRLQYRDQAEGFIGQAASQNKAPPGAITVASAPIDADDAVPKGFYLRCIEGKLWLRGYRSDDQHHWAPEDRFAFVEP